jgi:hypothetical protein
MKKDSASVNTCVKAFLTTSRSSLEIPVKEKSELFPTQCFNTND